MPTRFDVHDFIVRYGNLSQQMQQLLELAGADGIIVFDFFNNFKILLDLRNRSLKLERHTD